MRLFARRIMGVGVRIKSLGFSCAIPRVSRSWLVFSRSIGGAIMMVISGWISVAASPSDCSCSLSRSCPRWVLCSWWVFSTNVSVDCWVSRRSFCSVDFLWVFCWNFPSGVAIFFFHHLVRHLEVFRFCHCSRDVLFTRFFLLSFLLPICFRGSPCSCSCCCIVN